MQRASSAMEANAGIVGTQVLVARVNRERLFVDHGILQHLSL